MEKDNLSEEVIEEPWWKGPIKWILAVFLALLLVIMIVPRYAIKLDPEPQNIPDINEFEEMLSVKAGNRTNDLREAIKNVEPSNPVIRQIAARIASQSCERSRTCQAKALYYFVRDNIEYVSDPFDEEYIEHPTEVLQTKGADCESGTLVLAALEEAIGINAEIVIITGHAYLRINLPDALRKYKRDNDWVYLDWTCKSCDFGEIPIQNIGKRASFLEV